MHPWSSVLVRGDGIILCCPCRHRVGSGLNHDSAVSIRVTPLTCWEYRQSQINTENTGINNFEKYAKSSKVLAKQYKSYTSNYIFQFKQIIMALLVFVAAVQVHVPAVFIRGSAVRVGDSL